jgi:predicted dehydrogenase
MGKKIIIIGCGGIGSRHLQALCKIDIPVNIFAIDVNEQSLINAKKIVGKINNNNIQSLEFIKEFPKKINEIDLCIIATSSNVRLNILKKLISTYSIKNLILEKVLFQSINELDEAKEIIHKNKIKCWVNHTRREDECWKDMKKMLSDYSNVKLYYGKHNWNLCSVSIHIIDLAIWLFNEKIVNIDNSNLDSKIHQSKRKGFIEMTGILNVKFKNGNTIQLESRYGNSNEKAIFEISNKKFKLIVNEFEGTGILYREENNWVAEPHNFYRLLQSEKTQIIAKKILENNQCDLTQLNESIEIHKPVLMSFMDHLNKNSNSKYNYCPIT